MRVQAATRTFTNIGGSRGAEGKPSRSRRCQETPAAELGSDPGRAGTGRSRIGFRLRQHCAGELASPAHGVVPVPRRDTTHHLRFPEGPRVRRLAGGGNRIRTFGPGAMNAACELPKQSAVIGAWGGLFDRTNVPDAGGRERQLVRHRPERDQSIADGVGHQAADRDNRTLAGALDAKRVAR
jgi:hypothetical protein